MELSNTRLPSGDGNPYANPGVALPPSPFLPGTKIRVAWDSTCIGAFKTCPRLYQLSILEGWTNHDESVHLRFGIEYHQALQDYDLSRADGVGHDDAVHDVIHALLDRTEEFNPDHKTKTREGLLRTVVWYLDKFRDDPATTHILSDGKPAVEQSFRFELDWGPESAEESEAICRAREQGNFSEVSHINQHYVLCGHLDRIVNFAGELYVMDRKTTSYKPSQWYFTKYEPDNQMTLYSLAGKVVLNAPIRGVIIDAAQIGDGWTEFGRGITMRTEEQIEEWLGDLRYWFARAEACAIEDYYPMNDTACDKFGGCRFREICSKSPRVREQFLKSKFKQLPPDQRWNPLIPRG